MSKKPEIALSLNEKGALPQLFLQLKPIGLTAAGIIIFLIVSCFIVRDDGMNIDSQKNFPEGEA